MRYVVVGAGAAGISAARTLRQLDREGDIVLVSKDDKVHSRCMPVSYTHLDVYKRQFLNEDNLCDIYAETGPENLCRTCRTYPRHIEEFEGCREISLCMSCIEAAKLILGSEEPVRFITKEDGKEESYGDFDFFLYTKLMDTRELALSMLQDRSMDISMRISMCDVYKRQV